MSTIYELWDLRSGNAVGGFETEAEALDAVRALVQDHGRSYVDDLSLVREDENGDTTPLAKGATLTDLALRSRRHANVPVLT